MASDLNHVAVRASTRFFGAGDLRVISTWHGFGGGALGGTGMAC